MISSTPNTPPAATRGYLIAVVSAIILSTTAIFIRHLTQTYHVPALVLAFWRDVFVVVSLLPILRLVQPRRLHLSSQYLLYLILYGLVLAVFNSFWTLAVALNGAAVATVLVYSSTAFTALLGRWLLKERLDWVKLGAVFLCFGGCVLVANALEAAAWRANPLGILAGILAGLSYAGYSLMGRSAAQRGLSSWTTLLYTFGFAACFLLGFNLLSVGLLPAGFLPGAAGRLADFFWLGYSWAGWGVLFVLAAGPTVLGFGLYNVSLSYLPSSVANLIVTSEPAFTAIIAYFVLGERLSGAQLLGGVMILAGVVFLRLYAGQGRSLMRPKAGMSLMHFVTRRNR